MSKLGRKLKKTKCAWLQRWQNNNTPWNKGEKYTDSTEIASFKRIKASDLPVSRTHDLSTVHRLRPQKEKPANKEEEKDVNFIVGLRHLQQLVDNIQDHDKKCRGKLETNIKSRRGLLAFIQMQCAYCDVSAHPVPMTDELHIAKTGPPASALNERLALACTKSKLGPSDALFLLATLNITPPNDSVIYRKLNRTGEVIIEATEKVMLANQELIHFDTTHNRLTPEVTVEADGAYNNRLQSGFEAGTQSFSALIDNDRGLVLSCGTANKLCLKRHCTHENCAKNFDTYQSIASSEVKLIQENLTKVAEAKKINVNAITTDASAQVEKMLRETKNPQNLKHYLCIVHRMRSFNKALKSVQLTSTLSTGTEKTVFKKKLVTAFRKRLYWEITIGAKRNRSPNAVRQAVDNVYRCFSGQHENCKKHSVICRGETQLPPRYLPYGKYINLNGHDEALICTVINKYFNATQLERIRHRNTNKCENLHSMIFTYAPKMTLYARNFKALCHSAVHSKTFGTAKSTLKLANCMNIKNSSNSAMSRYMAKHNARCQYHAERQGTQNYKRNRYLARKRKLNRDVIKNSLYKNKAKAGTEHNYGLNCAI